MPRLRRRVLRLLLGLIGVVLLLVGGAVAVLLTVDLAPFVARQATAALDRRVSVGGLAIRWRNPLGIELHDVRLANQDWGSEPDMLRLDRLSGAIDLRALWHGVLRFERLRVDGLSVLLERDDKGAGNWRFKGAGTKPSPRGGLAVVPANRTQFPTLIDFALHGGEVRYRTASGGAIRIRFDEARIASDGDDAPTHLSVTGAYNDTPVQVTADADSFARLRNPEAPFAARIALDAAPGSLTLDATFTEPVDFEGAHGALHVSAPVLEAFLHVFGADLPADFPVDVDGVLDRRGDHWTITDARGELGGNPFRGAIEINEGARGRPDALMLDLGFDQLDVDRLIKRSSGPGDWRDLDLTAIRPEEKPGAIVDARVAAQLLTRGSMRLPQFAARAKIGAGETVLERVGFALAGGRVDGKGHIQAVPQGTRLQADLTLDGADAAQLMALLKAGGLLAGQVAGRATIDIAGAKVRDGLASGGGMAVIAMTGGRLAVDALEKVSLDIRALFRKNERWTDLTCLLGVVDLRQGIATLAPARLKAARTTVLAGGRIDLLRERLDLTVKAEGAGPSVLALKVPVSVSGKLDDPSIKPLAGSTADWLGTLPYNAPVAALPAPLKPIAEANACAK